MKRSICSAVATAVGLGMALPLLAASPAEAAKTVKVKSSVTIGGYDGSNIDKVVFWGKVKAKKQKKVCRTKRTVKLSQTTDKIVAGKAKTNKSGKWKVTFDGNKIDPGDFKVQVAKKIVKVKGKKVVCKAAKMKYDLDNLPH